MSETKQGTLGYTEDSLGNKVIAIDERRCSAAYGR